jgi:hypothetical protein
MLIDNWLLAEKVEYVSYIILNLPMGKFVLQQKLIERY